MASEFLAHYQAVDELRCSMLIGPGCGRLCRPKLHQAFKQGGPNRVWNLEFKNAFGPDYSFLGEFLGPLLSTGSDAQLHENTAVVVSCRTEGDLENLIRGVSWDQGQPPNTDVAAARRRIKEAGRFLVAADTSAAHPAQVYHYLGTDEDTYLAFLTRVEPLPAFTADTVKHHVGRPTEEVVDTIKELLRRRQLFLLPPKPDSHGEEKHYCSLAHLVQHSGKPSE